MNKICAVYILASQRNGTLYTGVTSELLDRIYQHKNPTHKCFSEKYKVNQLVYAEYHEDIYEAIKREKCIKKWNRKWKLRLIESANPNWKDLYIGLFPGSPPARG